MKFKDYLKTWEGLQQENKWQRVFQGGLILTVLILVMLVAGKKTIVTVQPFTLTGATWVTSDTSSREYKEAWGMALAELLGNVTPQTVVFVKDRLAPLLSPRIYRATIDAIESQSQKIKQNGVSLRFEPREVYYEASTDKVMVQGYSYTQGRTGEPRKATRTYEFQVKIAHYAPVIAYIDTYEGVARSAETVRKLEQREKAKAADEEIQRDASH